MFAVAEENLNQLPPPIYPPYLCLPLSLSLSVPPPFSGFNPGFFFDTQHFSFFPAFSLVSLFLRWTNEEKKMEEGEEEEEEEEEDRWREREF